MHKVNICILAFLFSAVTAVVTSCGEQETYVPDVAPEYVSLTLHISPLSGDNDPEDDDNTTGNETTEPENGENNKNPAEETVEGIEIVKSLRIIIVDGQTGRIETTEYASLENVANKELDYKSTMNVTSGLKRVYVIANEESISEYSNERIDGTDIDTKESIKVRLDGFIAGNDGFEEFINSLYFEPDYKNPLPLTCMYELDLKQETETRELYLVPVAVKFKINFYNYRNENVVFKEVSIEQIADKNYLMANVDEESKTIKGKYWIDWLKEVSEASTAHPDLNDTNDSNDKVNENWGWLTGYNLPKQAEHKSCNLFAGDKTWEVPYQKNETAGTADAGTLSKGPFFLPESKNLSNPQNPQSPQKYAIKFVVAPTTTEEEKVFTRELPGLTALFRNTFLYIDVDLDSGAEYIYVEIKAWNQYQPVYDIIGKE